MDTVPVEFGMEQVKKEMNHHVNGDFRTDSVKQEPCILNDFTEFERYDESSEKDSVDHQNAPYNCEEFYEEKFDINKPNSEYVDYPEFAESLSISDCKKEQMKNENDIDFSCEDIKSEIVEEKLCEVCNSLSSETNNVDSKNIKKECSCLKQIDSIYLKEEYMIPDVKPSSPGPTTDFELQLLNVQDESTNEQVSLAALQRDSGSPWELDKKLTFTDIPDKNCAVTDENNVFVNNKTTDAAEKKFKCEICSKYLHSAKYLKIHQRMHAKEKPFHCELCPKSFVFNSQLKAHSKTHAGEKPFICEICSKAYTNKCNLKTHSKIHTQEMPSSIGNRSSRDKPFHCKICSKSFDRSGHLKRHLMSRTEKGQFHCEFCSKSYCSNSYLNAHLKIHTRENLFSCKVCSKSFISNGTLNAHLKSHVKEKPFCCKICSESFATNRALKEHSKIHPGEKLYFCKICPESFSHFNEFIVHERTHI